MIGLLFSNVQCQFAPFVPALPCVAAEEEIKNDTKMTRNQLLNNTQPPGVKSVTGSTLGASLA